MLAGTEGGMCEYSAQYDPSTQLSLERNSHGPEAILAAGTGPTWKTAGAAAFVLGAAGLELAAEQVRSGAQWAIIAPDFGKG